ncbi:hypothetical protein LOK49_LG09G00043 [Camellia lanceoleosa]|uniref:Uncharacterized protein n=1 Tax=Camellia lanceoleosa TaxID=1840588 RepID=A0ACC0GJW6_9ERIC|nr:hypothetical protein LOK49_LG09G00043 [Camellia lanceoleosa]
MGEEEEKVGKGSDGEEEWKMAIPILIGTKFDDFVQLLPDLQWTIVTQVLYAAVRERSRTVENPVPSQWSSQY